MTPTPSARQLRKAAVQGARVAVALGQKVETLQGGLELVAEVLFSRGFFGRLKWLLTGK